jgi:hypothetical protein
MWFGGFYTKRKILRRNAVKEEIPGTNAVRFNSSFQVSRNVVRHGQVIHIKMV